MKLHSPALPKYLLASSLSVLFLPALSAQTHKAIPPTDSHILGQIQKTFSDEHAFAGSSIFPSVNHGVVTLTGNVRSEAEKSLASAEIGNINGIKTVLNNLNIVDNSFHAPPPPKPVVGPTGPKVIGLPVGTVISVRTEDEINTKTAKANNTFHGTTATTVMLNGFTLIPSGTPVIGRVIDAKAAGHFTGSAELAVELVSLKLSGQTGPQDISLVTQPLSNKAVGRGINTAEKTGGGAAAGAVIGALAGGGTGAGIGALSGGALGAGANAITRGKEIDIKPEQLLQFRTSAPLDVTVMLRDGHQVLQTGASVSELRSRPQQ